MEEARFRAALDAVLAGERHMELHYQPIVDLRRATVVGYEALARFPGPPDLSPDRWLQGAQGRGKRGQLETLMMRKAIQARALLPPDTFLSLNVSPIFLLSHECDALLQEAGDLKRLVLEITEGDRIHDYKAFRVRLEGVRAMGGSVAIDDTGSGYASLRHVMQLRPQFVKLDRFFIENCNAEPAKSELIAMIGETADRMDAWLVAEGIETEGELQELMRRNVPLAQGYYLGRPAAQMMPLPDELRETILSRRQVSDGPGLCQHMVSVPVYDSVEQAEDCVRKTDRMALAVVVDANRQPLCIVEEHPLMGVRTITDVMRVQVASDVAEVLRRAMGRPQPLRFDPIAVIGESGEFHGILGVDQLALAGLSK